MSAELLREAAAKMRERAKAASEGPWKTYDAKEWYGGTPAWEIDYVPTSGICEGEDVQVAGGADRPDAEHIASWHPAVALAVADWLDRAAVLYPHEPEDPRFPGSETARALAVARAYLGRDS